MLPRRRGRQGGIRDAMAGTEPPLVRRARRRTLPGPLEREPPSARRSRPRPR